MSPPEVVVLAARDWPLVWGLLAAAAVLTLVGLLLVRRAR